MITREWILITVIVLQVVGMFAFATTLFSLMKAGWLTIGVFADIGGLVLMLWVSVSHLMLIRKYKTLRQRVSP